MDEKTVIPANGLVIREFPLNDKDKLLTVLTGELGKVTVLARGVKSITSKRASGLSLFCYSAFEFEMKGDKLRFKDASPINTFFDINDTLEGFALASYIAEASGECAMEGNDESELLRLALNCLFAIEKKLRPIGFIKAVFEFKAACILGFTPDTGHCAVSGVPLPLPTASAMRYAFGMTEGYFIAEDSFKAAGDTINSCAIIQPEVFAAIKYLAAADQKKMLSFVLDEKYESDFEKVCEDYFIAKTEKKCKSLGYYKKIVGQI